MPPASDLVAHALTKTYGSASPTTTALAGVDVTVRAGESVAVMGPSGSGKSTLLHCLAGVVRPTSGEVVWRGRPIGSLPDAARTALRRTDFGFVFQSGQLLPELPADENAALPLMLRGVGRAEAVTAARAWLARLGLQGLESRRPGELSGGQAQRVAIARAMAASPGVIFADEPTGALDQISGRDVLEVLTGAARSTGASLVVVTHDEQVASWCERVIGMQDGRIVSERRPAHARSAPATVGVPVPGTPPSPVGATGVTR